MSEKDKGQEALNELLDYTLENEGDRESSVKDEVPDDFDTCPECGFLFKKSWNLKRCPRCGMCLNCG